MVLSKSTPAIEGGSPIRKSYLPFCKPSLGSEERVSLYKVIKSGWLTTGPKVSEFENIFSKYVGVKYAIGLNSCTAGLHLSLLSLKIKEKDEVITTPFTFAATANVILYLGAYPVFVDIEEDNLNIDPEKIEKVITKKTRAIIPVHFAGTPCYMDRILEIAKKYKIYVIEDAAHALGAVYKGKKIGSISHLTSFSFYPTKNITTGEGGIVTTNNRYLAERIRLLSLHGLSRDAWKRYLDKDFKYKHLEVKELGYKYNMSDIQASLGIEQIKKIERFLKIRKRIKEFYDKAFKDIEEIEPLRIKLPEHSCSAYHLYVIKINREMLRVDRDFIVQALQKENIGVSVHFKVLHLHTYYRKRFGFKKGSFPVAENASDRVISLPLYPDLRKKDLEDVIEAVKKVVKYYRR